MALSQNLEWFLQHIGTQYILLNESRNEGTSWGLENLQQGTKLDTYADLPVVCQEVPE